MWIEQGYGCHNGIDNKMQAIAFKCISFCNKKKLKRWFEKTEKKASQFTEQRTKTTIQYRFYRCI